MGRTRVLKHLKRDRQVVQNLPLDLKLSEKLA